MKRPVMRSAAGASAALRFPAHSIKRRVGTSFKQQHLHAILADGKRDRLFDVHAENDMGAGGPPHAALGKTAKTILFRSTAFAYRSAARRLEVEVRQLPPGGAIFLSRS